MSRRTVLLVAALVAAAVPAPAAPPPDGLYIYNGYVKGRLLFYQNQGNYCPTTRDCTDAKYLQAQYHTNQPVAAARVYLRNYKTGEVIGQGGTDTSGNFTLSWSANTWPITGQVIWRAQHKDGVFAFLHPDGSQYLLISNTFGLTNGTTASAPQDRGSLSWGSSSAPNQISNAYDGAWRMWFYALSSSNRMVANFNGLTIYAFSDTTPGACATSCANGSRNTIQLDANAAFSPQERVMHEMGHIASYQSDHHVGAVDYEFPSTGKGGSWSTTTAEWKATSFEEALATFLGTRAIYHQANPTPMTCLSSSACGSSFNLETGSSTCATDEDRQALSTMRYLWDVYDSTVDSSYSDTVSTNYFQFFDTLNAYPAGTGDGERDEPWNWAHTALDDRDGHSSADFQSNFSAFAGVSTSSQRSHNCSP
jgi:hypothetical protein